MAQSLKIDEEQRLPVDLVQLCHAGPQKPRPFCRLHGFLHQFPRLRFLRQRVQREAVSRSLFVQQPQGHVPRRLVEVGAKAAVPDGRPFGDEIGKGFDHQVLRLVKVAEVAVQIEGQLGAVTLHKRAQGILVSAEVEAV